VELQVELFLDWIKPLATDPLMLSVVLGLLGFVNVFFPPIPIEAMALAAGAVGGAGYGNLLVVWLATASGMAVGSTLLYLLAVAEGPKVLHWGCIARQLPAESLQRIRSWFDRFGVLAIFLGKLVPGFSFATVLASGLFGLRKSVALPAIYAANLLFFGVLVLAGRYLGRDWRRYVDSDLGLRWTILGVAAAVAALAIWRYTRRRSKTN
jgi:membrane protein DedA with SNARE-associated domain